MSESENSRNIKSLRTFAKDSARFKQKTTNLKTDETLSTVPEKKTEQTPSQPPKPKTAELPSLNWEEELIRSPLTPAKAATIKSQTLSVNTPQAPTVEPAVTTHPTPKNIAKEVEAVTSSKMSQTDSILADQAIRSLDDDLAGTIIKETRQTRVGVFSAMFEVIGGWIHSLFSIGKKRRVNEITVTAPASRAEVIKTAAAGGRLAPRREHLKLTRRPVVGEEGAQGTIAVKKKSEVAPPAWSHYENEGEIADLKPGDEAKHPLVGSDKPGTDADHQATPQTIAKKSPITIETDMEKPADAEEPTTPTKPSTVTAGPVAEEITSEKKTKGEANRLYPNIETSIEAEVEPIPAAFTATKLSPPPAEGEVVDYQPPNQSHTRDNLEPADESRAEAASQATQSDRWPEPADEIDSSPETSDSTNPTLTDQPVEDGSLRPAVSYVRNDQPSTAESTDEPKDSESNRVIPTETTLKRRQSLLSFLGLARTYSPFIVVAILAIALGVGVSLTWLRDSDPEPSAPSARPPALFSADREIAVSLPTERDDLLVRLREETINNAGLIQIYPTLGTADGVERAASVEEILSVLEPRLPAALSRNIRAVAFGATSGNNPLLILSVDNFETAFAGMLDWEQNLASDLQPWFESGSGEKFTDTVLENRSMRVQSVDFGSDVAAYIFANQNTIIISNDREGLREVLPRIR